MTTTQGSTSLMYAASTGQLLCCDFLKSYESGMINFKQETALMYAAYYGFAEICKILLSEATKYNEYGEFALIYGI